MGGDVPHRLNDVADALVSGNLLFGGCVEHPSFMHAKLCEEMREGKGLQGDRPNSTDMPKSTPPRGSCTGGTILVVIQERCSEDNIWVCDG